MVDLFSRKVMGWALQATLASMLVEEALKMAVGRRKPHRACCTIRIEEANMPDTTTKRCYRLMSSRVA